MFEAKLAVTIWYERPGISGSGIYQRKSLRKGLWSTLEGECRLNFYCCFVLRLSACLPQNAVSYAKNSLKNNVICHSVEITKIPALFYTVFERFGGS